MSAMRKVTVCWAPECSEVVPSKGNGRPGRYHTTACKQRAFRRAGGKAPTEPYPPLTAGSGTDVPPPERGVIAKPASTKPTGRTTRRTVKAPPKETPPVAPVAGGEGAGAVPEVKHQPAPAATSDAGAFDPTAAVSDGTTGALAGAPAPPATVTQLHIAVTEDATIPVTITVHPMVAQYRADLERMNIADTRQGLHIIAMAEKLVSSSTSAAAATTVSKELERLMEAAEENTPAARIGRDPSAAIRERTIAKLTAVSA